MELDDLKAKTREIVAPSDHRGAEGRLPDELLRDIQGMDERTAKQARRAKPLYASAAAAFLAGSALTLFSVAPAAGPRAMHLAVLGAVFLVVVVLLHSKARAIARIDYSKPVTEFLADAERRYRPMRAVELSYAIPLLLLLALTGGRLVVAVFIPRYIDPGRAAVVIMVYAAFFLLVCGLGCYFTYKNWQRESRAILVEIRRMRQEME